MNGVVQGEAYSLLATLPGSRCDGLPSLRQIAVAFDLDQSTPLSGSHHR